MVDILIGEKEDIKGDFIKIIIKKKIIMKEKMKIILILIM